jgi:23S rRNA A2030 N6-methylase RlmJ
MQRMLQHQHLTQLPQHLMHLLQKRMLQVQLQVQPQAQQQQRQVLISSMMFT